MQQNGCKNFFFFLITSLHNQRRIPVDRQVCQQLWLHERKMVAQQNLGLPFNTGHCLAMLKAKARFSVPVKNPGDILRVSWKDTAVPKGEEFIASPGCWHLEMCYLSPAVQSGCTTVVSEEITPARFHLRGRRGKANSDFLSGHSAGTFKVKTYVLSVFFLFLSPLPLRFGTKMTIVLYHVLYKPKRHFQISQKQKKTKKKLSKYK